MEKTNCAENYAKKIVQKIMQKWLEGGTLKSKSIAENQLDKIANFHMKKIVENR